MSYYRPICLPGTVGKVFERLIATRLSAAVEYTGGLSNSQYGFRKGRSTLDAIATVDNEARNAISETRWKGDGKMYCLIVTLNIRNAFNSGDWDKTLES